MPEKKENRAVVDRKYQTMESNTPKGKNYLLIICIDQYVHCPPLNNAVKDATDFINILFEKYNFQEEQLVFLKNEDANKDNIIDAFRGLKRRLTPTDNLLIYYSGHGEIDSDFEEESYLVTVDSRKGKVGDYLSHEQLIRYIRAIKTHHTLLILDACFAGVFMVNRRSVTAGALEKDPSRYVIASGRKEYADDGKAGENSPFATALLEKLATNEDSLLTSDLAQYIMKQTIKATNKLQRPIHSPLQIKEDKGGQFVFHTRKISEDTIWEITLEKSTIAAFQKYLREYKEGKYREDAHWKIAQKRNTVHAFDDYLDAYSDGQYASIAEEKMHELEEEEVWKSAKTLAAYRSYTRKYKQGKYRDLALKRIKELKENRVEEESVLESTTPIIKQPKIINPTPHIIEDPNNFTDPRDGQTYKTVKLKDGKIWMAQNFNFDAGEDCWFYDNDGNNGKKYGRLYTWEVALKACPNGWHLPSLKELKNLINVYGSEENAYAELIEGGNSGFSAMFGGFYRYSGGDFRRFGIYGSYWSSMEMYSSFAWTYSFLSDAKYLRCDYHEKNWARSCRYLQD